MNNQALYDDISEVIKERVDNFELKDNVIEELLSAEAINEMLHDLTEFGMTATYISSYDNNRGFSIQLIPADMHTAMPASIYGCNNKIIVVDEIELAKMKEPELIQFDCWKEEKQPKENHPHGWYRKFEKKRY